MSSSTGTSKSGPRLRGLVGSGITVELLSLWNKCSWSASAISLDLSAMAASPPGNPSTCPAAGLSWDGKNRGVDVVVEPSGEKVRYAGRGSVANREAALTIKSSWLPEPSDSVWNPE